MERYGFFNSVNGDRPYDANDFVSYLGAALSNGVLGDSDDSLAVAANESVGVSVNIGRAVINGYWFENQESKNISLAADKTYNIVVSVDLSARQVEIKAKTEAVTDNEIILATVITPAIGNVTESNITDKRTFITGRVLDQKFADLAGRLAAAESKLVKDWQPLGETTGSTPLIIPSGAKELAAIIYVNNNKLQSLLFNIPLDMFDAGTAYCFSTGFYQNATSFYSAEVQIEGNNFLMSRVYQNENTNNRRINSTMKVMWR